MADSKRLTSRRKTNLYPVKCPICIFLSDVWLKKPISKILFQRSSKYGDLQKKDVISFWGVSHASHGFLGHFFE